MNKVSRREPLIESELSALITEFNRIEIDLARLSDMIGAAYGRDWGGRGLRIAQLVRALSVRVEDHGYDRLSSQDRAAFQNAQRSRWSRLQTLSALETTIEARKTNRIVRRLLAEPATGGDKDNSKAADPSFQLEDLHSPPTPAGKAKHGATQLAALPWRIAEDGTCQVLLLTSRETRRWVIPKGWPIKGRKPAEVAEREAYEEAGLRGRVVGKRPLGNFYYEKQLPIGAVLCKVQVYLFRVDRQEDVWPERLQRVTRWFDAAEAASRVDESDLGEIIRRLQR